MVKLSGAGQRAVLVTFVVGLAALLLPWTRVEPSLAQEPEGPPLQAIHCVRPFPETLNPELPAPADFAVTLDETRAVALLAIGAFEPDITCFVVYSNLGGPIAFAWDEERLFAPNEPIESALPSAGEYCYQLLVANPTGHSDWVERCINVPDSVAPTPTATTTPPYAATPAPPGVGSGLEHPSTDSPAHGLLVAILASLAVASAISVVAVALRGRP